VLKLSKNIHHRNPDFAICEITMQSEPSDQALIWTVDSSQWRGIGDRELDMSKIIDIRNSDIAICEITMQSEPSDQALIWTVDSSQ
jgi:hypothetical protein